LADTVLDDENEDSKPEADELVVAGADDEAGEQ
jgi:hypothetical protein